MSPSPGDVPSFPVKLTLPPPTPGWAPSDDTLQVGNEILFFVRVSFGSVTAAQNSSQLLCRLAANAAAAAASPSSTSEAAAASFYGRASLRNNNVVAGGGRRKEGEEIEVFQYSFTEDDIKGQADGERPRRRWVEGAAVKIE